MTTLLVLPLARGAPRPARGVGDGRILNTAEGRFLAGPPTELRHIMLVMGGATRDPDVIPANATREGVWRRAIDIDNPGEFGVPANRGMQARLQSFLNDGTRHNAGMLLLGPDAFTPPPDDPDPYRGMPDDVFYESCEGGGDEHTSFLASELAASLQPVCATANPTGRFVPATLGVCVDVLYSAKYPVDEDGLELIDRGGTGAPVARTGGRDAELREVPLLRRGSLEPVQNENNARLAWAQAFLDELCAFFEDDLPNERSGRVLDTVVGFFVWAAPFRRGVRRRQPVGGYIPGGPARAAAKALALSKQGAIKAAGGAAAYRAAATAPAAAELADTLAVPAALLACHGLVQSNPELLDDGRCVARAVMTALDPFVYASSDVAYVNIRRKAADAAQAKLQKLVRAVQSATTDAGKATAQMAADLAYERTLGAREAAQRAADAATKAGWHVRPPNTAENTGIYKAKARYAAIEAALGAALAGTHPEVDFRNALFSKPFVIDETTVAVVRAAIKDEAKVAIQFWGVGTDERIALVYPDPRATLDFLDAGGRVLNIFYGYGHASAIRSVSACCNHRAHRGAGEPGADGRLYCPLCAFYVSNGAVGGAWEIAKHAERGCAEADAVLPAALTPGNRVQLSRVQASASVYAPPTMAVLSAATETSDASDDGFTIRNAQLCMYYKTADMDDARCCIDPSLGPDAVKTLLEGLVRPASVDALSAVWSVDAHVSRAEAELLPSDCCSVCASLLSEASSWDTQAEMLLAASEDRAPCKDFTPATTEFSVPTLQQKEVLHASCAESVRKTRRATLPVFCTSSATFAAAVRVVFGRDFIEQFCDGEVPTVQRGKRGLRRVSFLGTGCDKRTTVVFHIILLPAYFGDASPGSAAATLAALDCDLGNAEQTLHALISFAEREWKESHLWPLAFTTLIAYNRARLLRLALTHCDAGDCPTAIANPESLASAQKLVRAGYVWTGVRAHWPAPDVSEALHHRFLLDVNAAYPHVLKTYPMPFHEHADRVLFDFGADSLGLSAGLDFVRLTSPDTEDMVIRIEVSGHWPKSTHGFLRQLPPVLTSIGVTGADLSAFQRRVLKAGTETSLGTRTTPHLLPVRNATVFLATAQLWGSLGFKFEHIGKAWGTPARRWTRAWAEDLEKRRTAAAEAGHKPVEAYLKLLCNSTVGSLGMNTAAFTSVIVRKAYPPVAGVDDDSCSDSREGLKALSDDDRCTLRTWTAADCLLYEMRPSPRSLKPQLLIAAAYVTERARTSLLEAFYGTSHPVLFTPPRPGLIDIFAGCQLRVVYAATDALLLDVKAPPGSTLSPTDILLASAFKERLHPRAWGAFKDETNFAGIGEVVVNGPNRWGARVLQNERTLPKHRGSAQAESLLKALPTSLEETVTFDEYAASWLQLTLKSKGKKAEVVEADDESIGSGSKRRREYTVSKPSASATAVLRETRGRTGFVSVWRNVCSIVHEDGEAFPLGYMGTAMGTFS